MAILAVGSGLVAKAVVEPGIAHEQGVQGDIYSLDRWPDLRAELEALNNLDLHALRVRWRKLTRSSPPDNLSRPLLVRLIAHKIQAQLFGDLDPETARYLAQVAKARQRRLKAGAARDGKKPPPVPAVPPRLGLKPGTLIGREFNGIVYRVIVVEGGFEWNGAIYSNLSAIARLITGTRWSGPRFFALKCGSAGHGA